MLHRQQRWLLGAAQIATFKATTMKSNVDFAKIDHAGDLSQGRNSLDRATPVTGRTAILTPARTRLLLAFITLIGAVLRLHSLAVRSLWIDEAASVSFASLAWKPFIKVLWGYQGNMALYYFLLHEWIHLGDSEFAVRSLSVLLGVLTISAVYLLAARLFDRPTGLISASLLAVHSFHIHWSQETRAYSLLILLLVLTTYALVAALESSKLSYWLVFSVLAALCVYAHIFALLVLTAHALAIIFPKPFRVELPTVVASAAVFAFLCEPMAAFVILQHSDQLSWMARPSLADIWDFLKLLTSQGGVLLVVVYLALCGLAFLQPAGVKRPAKESWALRLMLVWLLSLPLLTLAVSLIKPFFYPRYMVICVPALVILAARGLVNLYEIRVMRHWVAAAAFVLVIALSGWGTYRYFVNFPMETSDWRSAVRYILQRQRPGDGAVFFLPNTYCYRYYIHRSEESQHQSISAPDVLYPPSPTQPVTRAEVQQVTFGHERVWLILHIDSINPQASATIQSTLGETYRIVDKHEFPGEDLITVALYDHKPVEQ
jgi:mannosyltransferase